MLSISKFILRFTKNFLLSFTTERGGIVVKAEGIGGEREGDFMDNFNNVWKMSQNCCGEFCPKHGKLLNKTEEDNCISFYTNFLKYK